MHLYEKQELLELQHQGIQKKRDKLTTLNKELKKTRAQASIFSTFEGEDIKGEYIDPIPASNLSTSPNSEPKATPVTQPKLL